MSTPVFQFAPLPIQGTVIDVAGVIAIGTESGKVLVYNSSTLMHELGTGEVYLDCADIR